MMAVAYFYYGVKRLLRPIPSLNNTRMIIVYNLVSH